MPTIYFFLIAFILLKNCLHAQRNEQLKEQINALLERQHLAGSIWSVVTGNGQIETGSSGMKNMQTKQELTQTDKMLVGSVAKTLVAAGFLRMATKGIINLNDPVKKYLPELPLKNKWENTSPVTIKHLLDHTAGLTDAKLWQVFSTGATPAIPLETVYTRSPEVLVVHTRPGSIYSYSNIGYNILGMIIESISMYSYEEYLAKELLQPLGMYNSSFHYVSQEHDRQLAFGHFDDGQPVFALPMYLRTAGQFTTTAEDMGRFLRFMMSDGTINGTPFIDKELLARAGNQTTTEAFMHGVANGDALGLYRRDRYGMIGLAKNGNTLGFTSMIYLFPAYQKAFFIAINTDRETSDYDVFNETLVHYLNLPARPFITKENAVEPEIKKWEGYYIPVLTKVKPFALVELVFAHTRVSVTHRGASMHPFLGKEKTLRYQGHNRFSMDNRTTISHAFYTNEEGAFMITDAVKTIKKISGALIIGITASLMLGLAGFLYLFIYGLVQCFKQKSAFLKSATGWIFLATATLCIAIVLISLQPFMQMGDLTAGTLIMVSGTILLPLTSMLSVIMLMIKQEKFYQLISFWASASVFQCCMLLMTNDLMPLFLWK